jgi:hypothetical protein
MADFDDVIYGERLGDLLPILRDLTKSSRLNNRGMCQLNGEFPANVAMPFFRALMSAEAELLLEDADALDVGKYEERRTNDQRSADAFVRVAEAVCALP